jgi:hypothetical protein
MRCWPKDKQCCKSKFTQEQVNLIYQRLLDGETIGNLAKEFNVGSLTIQRIKEQILR